MSYDQAYGCPPDNLDEAMAQPPSDDVIAAARHKIMEFYDLLPAELRDAVMYCSVPLNPISVFQAWKLHGLEAALWAIRDIDQNAKTGQ